MKIVGNTVGTSLPKPNMMQNDPSKGDYVKGKEEFLQIDKTLTIAGAAADAAVVGEKIGALSEEIANIKDMPDTSAFITRAVNDLANYYRMDETYTREEIDGRISAIPKFSVAVVHVLPTDVISETTIYLVPSGVDGNLYTEYIYVNGSWEILGAQRVDLTGYATLTWTLQQLAGYQPKGNYLTEHQDISGKLDANKLPEAVNTALAQAKASGVFDGKDGGTPTVTVTRNGSTVEIKVTNANGQVSAASVSDGADGVGIREIGESPIMTEDGEIGKEISVMLTDGSRHSFNIMHGKNGTDGVSPTIAVADITGGHRITITDKNGEKTVDVMNGAKGDAGRGITSIARTSGNGAAGTTDTYTITYTDGTTSTFSVYNGKNGTNGKTPVRFVDYWTPADQEAIVQQVIAALGTPVFGRVDENKVITLTGVLADGIYTIKYEDAEGNVTEIGTYTGGRLGDVPITPVWNKPYKLDSGTGKANADSGNTYAYSDGIPFIEGTELHISCSDTEYFHANWYYYDANDNFVGKTDWAVGTTNGTVTPKPETVIPQMAGAAVVKLRCNVTQANNWARLDRLTIFRRYL